ncbi:hypothetical protein BU23DRAFT_557637 [Bimuria novae-zelandiae CBS 107.79]|uniref:Fungal STAND N-terminal Goodbye domain-containing protein n=1 Tax=Bimuria novae-zelandiae CBS 107.79 TaxID=1447943 RepID=A0A6A5V352_9PLEO|nr:hypothetical protein BU23DRAFT_557637 [Bimuria novae-zelandiae CBS 107.79]
MADDKYVWFDADHAESGLLRPIHQLNDERDDWDLETISDDKDTQNASTLSVKRSPMQIYNTSRQDVEKEIAQVLIDEEVSGLSPELQSNLSLAANAFKDWRSGRRATAARKAGTALQSTASTIGDFLQSFAGVAEIVKGADQQFGGLAYGTVSVLLNVAVQKQRREEAIEEALEELAYAFPRLETLRRIRPTESLRALIVDVFTLVIKFCRETVDYFAQRKRRLAKALSPLKLKTLTSLRIKLSEIKEECTIATLEELAETRKSLTEVQEQLRRMETTGDDTNLRVRQGHEWLQRSHSNSRGAELQEIRQALGLKSSDDISLTVIIPRYFAMLQDEFLDLADDEENPRQMSWPVLKKEKKFSQWLEKEESSILLLGGDNWSDSSSTVLNWLSLASVLVAQAHSDATFRLNYFCQTDYANSRSGRRSFSAVIRNLVYQFAEQRPQALHERREFILEALRSVPWNSTEYSVSFDALAQLCINLFSMCQAGESLTIVLDRLDLCQWNHGTGTSALYEAICALQDIIRHKSLAHVRIKILLVMDGRPAQQVVKLIGKPGRGIDWKVDWDQIVDEN